MILPVLYKYGSNARDPLSITGTFLVAASFFLIDLSGSKFCACRNVKSMIKYYN